MTRFATVQIAAFALLGVALAHGWVQGMLAADSTYITHVIIGAFAVGWVASVRKLLLGGELVFVKMIAGVLVSLGLLGTLVGFVIALSGIDPASVADPTRISGMVASLMEGLGVAIYTTIVGLVGNVWLRINLYLLR